VKLGAMTSPIPFFTLILFVMTIILSISLI